MPNPKPDITNIIFNEKFKNFVCKEIETAQKENIKGSEDKSRNFKKREGCVEITTLILIFLRY